MQDEEMYKKTPPKIPKQPLLGEHMQVYMREKRKTRKHAFLMIYPQLLMVFLHLSPPLSFFFHLSVRFHQLALPAAALLLSDYTAPQRLGPPASPSSVYPALKSVFSPHQDQSLPFVHHLRLPSPPLSFPQLIFCHQRRKIQ